MKFQRNVRYIGDDGRKVDEAIDAVIREAAHPTDDEVRDAIDAALYAQICRGGSYRQVARALGWPVMTVYDRLQKVQDHIKARVKQYYGHHGSAAT